MKELWIKMLDHLVYETITFWLSFSNWCVYMTRVSLYPATPAAVYLRAYMGIITQPCVHITVSLYRLLWALRSMCTYHYGRVHTPSLWPLMLVAMSTYGYVHTAFMECYGHVVYIWLGSSAHTITMSPYDCSDWLLHTPQILRYS